MFFHLGHICLSRCTCYVVRGGTLGIHQGRATHITVLWCCMWGRGPRGNNAACSALTLLSVTSSTTHKWVASFWYWLLGGWACGCSRIPWALPMNSPVRLAVYPTATISTVFYSQRFWRFLSQPWVARSALLPSCFSWLSTRKHGTARSSSCHLAACLLHPGCLSLPLLPVWMNASYLTRWLSDFHIVWFFGSSGCFLFLNWLLSFFSLCKKWSISTYASILARSQENFQYLITKYVFCRFFIHIFLFQNKKVLVW